MRVSFYKEDVEVGFVNFVNPSGGTKTNFFSSSNLVGSSGVDMRDHTIAALVILIFLS